jgi:hypothetical protein
MRGANLCREVRAESKQRAADVMDAEADKLAQAEQCADADVRRVRTRVEHELRGLMVELFKGAKAGQALFVINGRGFA